MRVAVDEKGTFADASRVAMLELKTGSDGAALFQWFAWPRNATALDFVSVVSVFWENKSAGVYLEDLYE